MSMKLRRLLACVLLVLLPLQATAMASHCPIAPAAAIDVHTAPAQAMADCPHERAVNGDQSQPGDHKPGCAAMSTCALCAVAVNVSQAVKANPVHQQSVSFICAQYSSFIPEGLLRPPSILA